MMGLDGKRMHLYRLVYDTLIPFYECTLAEIDQEPEVEPQKTEVGQCLDREYRIVLVGGFAFHHNLSFYKNVNPQRIAHLNALVDDRDCHLFLHTKPADAQFVNQRILVDRLQKTRPTKRLVHRNCGVKNNLADLVYIHAKLCVSVPLSLCVKNPLDSINEPPLGMIENHNSNSQQNYCKRCAVAEGAPREGADAEDAVLEGFDDRRDGVGEHDGAHLGALDSAQRVDDGRRVHPELDEEAKQVGEITVLRREGAEDDSEAKSEPGEEEDEHWREENQGVGMDGGVGTDTVVGEDGAEEEHLDEESDKVARDGRERDDETREVHLAEKVRVGAESAARLVEAVGEVLPEADAGEVEEGLGKAIRGNAGDPAENDHVHDRRQNRLDEEPQGA